MVNSTKTDYCPLMNLSLKRVHGRIQKQSVSSWIRKMILGLDETQKCNVQFEIGCQESIVYSKKTY